VSKDPGNLTFQLRVVGAGLLFVYAVGIFVFGREPKSTFAEDHKTHIQGIANALCAAASEKSCEVTWGGKSKFFGTIQPSSNGTGKVGLDHIRKALPEPSWRESTEPGGVSFNSANYQVFYSSQSGAVSITSTTPAGSQ
jgi:hypothetical protein